MLIDYKVKNYKQFKNETYLSMVPDSEIDELSYSVLNQKVEDIKIDGLSTAIIYGPNAIGKTNLIQSLNLLRKIILNRSISTQNFNGTQHSSKIPNLELKERQDVEFEIGLVNQNNYYEYKLYLNLGSFGKKQNQKKIVLEELKINDRTLYKRKFNKIEFINPDYLINAISLEHLYESLELKLKPQNLFLYDCSILFKDDVIDNFINWFENKLLIIKDFDLINTQINQDDLIENTIFNIKPINDFLKSIDTNSKQIVFSSDEEDNSLITKSVINIDNQNNIMVNADEFESIGTIKLIKLIPILIQTLKTGATLIIDELDSSIHSTIVMGLISIFHDDRINTNNSQLIITTHNPIFMSPKLIRRDEVLFLDKNEQKEVELYSLADFKAVKKGDNYSENYLQNQYKALKDIDINQIFSNILNNEKSTA